MVCFSGFSTLNFNFITSKSTEVNWFCLQHLEVIHPDILWYLRNNLSSLIWFVVYSQPGKWQEGETRQKEQTEKIPLPHTRPILGEKEKKEVQYSLLSLNKFTSLSFLTNMDFFGQLFMVFLLFSVLLNQLIKYWKYVYIARGLQEDLGTLRRG